MIIVSTDEVAGKRIIESKGFVSGSGLIVNSSFSFSAKKVGDNLRNILNTSREQAIDAMREEATGMGC